MPKKIWTIFWIWFFFFCNFSFVHFKNWQVCWLIRCSNMRSEIKTKYGKIYLRCLPLCRFVAKTVKVNEKNCHIKFLNQIWPSESTLNCRTRHSRSRRRLDVKPRFKHEVRNQNEIWENISSVSSSQQISGKNSKSK